MYFIRSGTAIDLIINYCKERLRCVWFFRKSLGDFLLNYTMKMWIKAAKNIFLEETERFLFRSSGCFAAASCLYLQISFLKLNSKQEKHNWIFEVSHWFDQCDSKSFERSGSKVSPTVTPPCRTIGERTCRICIKACPTPSGIANIMLCLWRNIERKRYLGRFGSI
jgi:hypothetical protein